MARLGSTAAAGIPDMPQMPDNSPSAASGENTRPLPLKVAVRNLWRVGSWCPSASGRGSGVSLRTSCCFRPCRRGGQWETCIPFRHGVVCCQMSCIGHAIRLIA